MAGLEEISNEEKLKNLSERGLRFSGDKSKTIGQPTPDSHPHLMEEDEITPGISKKEYRDRRHRLLSLLAKTHFGETHDKHVVIIPSNPRLYMTTDVPYPFRQNTDFLYLTGFQEPDAVLVLQSVDGLPLPAHKSTLFIQPPDPKSHIQFGTFLQSLLIGLLAKTSVFGMIICDLPTPPFMTKSPRFCSTQKSLLIKIC